MEWKVFSEFTSLFKYKLVQNGIATFRYLLDPAPYQKPKHTKKNLVSVITLSDILSKR